MDELLDLLRSLDGVRQDPRYHPEGDALYHSLQAFDLARKHTPDRALWAAALLHDVGKAVDSATHDTEGAALLDGLVSPRIVYLVEHHLDLLRAPGPTRRRLRNTRSLADLETLRRIDLGARRTDARVMAPEAALTILMEHPETLFPCGETAHDHAHEGGDPE